MEDRAHWETARTELLGRRISELGLRIAGSPIEPLVDQLYDELDAMGLVFRPPVYLTDEWGCPSGVPLIGVPFYLADARLARIEEEFAVHAEGQDESIEYLRHEAGHAFNYAYRLYDRDDWRQTFGSISRPYHERFRVDPFSREHVRHILAWYAQKHPDEDFAETFAVWLTPGSDWRERYADWPALRKLEYVDRVMAEVGRDAPDAPVPQPEHLPVDMMHYTVGEHYVGVEPSLPIPSERHFDGDLRTIFAGREAVGREATDYLVDHRRELVRRIAYWTGEPTPVVRAFMDFITERVTVLGLRATRRETSILIALTAFGTAVLMNYRYTDGLGGPKREPEP